MFGKKTFFFVNYERFRESTAQTMTATVPTPDEARGDFSDAGVAIFNPFSPSANPKFDPTRPVSPTNPQIFRDPFPGNVIPAPLLNTTATRMAQNFVPAPNMMSDASMGMTMMGAPTVFGTNQDSNNFLDVRDMQHRNQQGTVRFDRVFNEANNLSVRYSISKEDGSPCHVWRCLTSPRTAIRTTSLANWALLASDSAGPQVGAPILQRSGLFAIRRLLARTPMQAWDTVVEARDTVSWQKGCTRSNSAAADERSSGRCGR